MIKYRYILILILLIVVVGCEEKTQNLEKLEFSNESQFSRLKEYLSSNRQINMNLNHFIDTLRFESKNKYFITEQSPFAFFSDRSILISSSYPDPFLAHYTIDGKFIKEFSRVGFGPGEYVHPGFVEIINDTLFQYDRSQMKINTFSYNGDFISYQKIDRIIAKTFKILPKTGDYLFYTLNEEQTASIFSIFSKTNNQLEDFGNNDKRNILSAKYPIQGITIDESDNIYLVQPHEYKIYAFNQFGHLLKEITRPAPDYFYKVNYYDILEIKMSGGKLSSLYFSHSRIRDIFYLDKGIIIIQIENPKINIEAPFPNILEFWTTSGIFIGSIETSIKIAKVERGSMFIWHESYITDKYNNIDNPYLIEYRFLDMINSFFEQ